MNSYGWLNREAYRGYHGHSGGSGGGAVATGYQYGWPSGGTSESNVTFQLLFDESSGNITDEVGSVVLTAGGTNVYNQAVTGDYEDLSPGILQDSSGDYFLKNTATSALSLGTGDATIEMWYKNNGTLGNAYLLNAYNGTTTRGWAVVFDSVGGGRLQWFAYADDGTAVFGNNGSGGAVELATGGPHKIRIVINRTTNLVTYYINGNQAGVTTNIAALSGKTISGHAAGVGAIVGATTVYIRGTIYEARFSQNATNNSGGPNGG